MPISVQQFDFLAETVGIHAAMARAEEAGGITGTRDVSTQIEMGPRPGSTSSKASLSGMGGQYTPGTVQTDTSQGIGEAGTAASGQTLADIMGGTGDRGGLATDVSTSSGQSLADLMNMFQGDTSAFTSNAPVVAPAPLAVPTPAEALMTRATAGEILTVADIATLDTVSDKDNILAIVNQVLGNLVGNLQKFGNASDQGGMDSTFKTIYELYDNFYAIGGDGPGGAHIYPLMQKIARDYGFGEFFEGQRQYLETRGKEMTLPPGMKVSGSVGDQNKQVTDFLLSHASQTDTWDKATAAAAKAAFGSQGDEAWDTFASDNGMPSFGSEADALRYFRTFWKERQDEDRTYWDDPTYLGATDNLGGAAEPPDPTTWTPGGGGVPGAPVIPGSGMDLGGLGATGLGAENRTFNEVFPGFLSTSGYADIPNVGSAIAAAAPFLGNQFGMVSPFIPETEIPAGQSRAGNWLRGLSTGDTSLLRGNPLAARLQEISAALGQPAGGSIGELGSGASINPLRGLYADPSTSASAAQVGAFQNPFYLSTRGAPTSRGLAMQQIQKAATDFAYKYPSGVPTVEGTSPEQFLPWALRTNLMGIQDLPEFQGVNWANI